MNPSKADNTPETPPPAGSVIKPGSSAEPPKPPNPPQPPIGKPTAPKPSVPKPIPIRSAPPPPPAPPKPPQPPPPALPKQPARVLKLPDHPLFRNSNPFQPPAPSAELPAEPGKKPGRAKVVVLVASLVILLLGGSASAYFGYIVPNKPENIWGTALKNTGKGYDKLSQYVSNRKAEKGTSIKGSFKLTGDLAADGSFSGSTSSDNSQLTGSLSAAGLKISLDLRAIKSSGSTPDIYIKADGLSGLGTFLGGDSQLGSALNGLNNQWYFIDHSFFDQFAKGANTNTQITTEDINSALTAVGNASRQYLFTSDAKNMAFTVQKKIGKETQDGRSVYHFKIGVNKQNLKNYVSSLCTNLGSSKLTKFFDNNAGNLKDALGCKNAAKTIDNIDSSRGTDAWVDLSTKLIHKIRFADKTNQEDYIDVGQNYTGGDKFPFTFGYHTKNGITTSSGSLQLVLNTSTNAISISGSAEGSGSGSNQSGSFDMTITPSSSTVKVEKPTGTKNVIELFNDLGLADLFSGISSGASGSTSTGGSSSSTSGSNDTSTAQSRDAQRKTDVTDIALEMDDYYAINGNYPTLAQINDASWRKTNLQGIDQSELKDPKGSSDKFSSSPGANVFSYQPTPAGCDDGSKGDCLDFTLTATLEGGGTFSKKASSANSF